MKRDVWQGLIYFSQLGLSLAAPPVGLSLLAMWAQRRFALGLWAPVTALVVGGVVSVITALNFFRAFSRIGQAKKKDGG